MNGYYSGVGTNLKFRLILKDKVHAIQTFYVGADYIYTLQRRRNQSDGELRDLAFSRLKIKKDRHGHPTGKAKQLEPSMILVGFGHSQILQYFTHGPNQQPYFWVATRGAQTNATNQDLEIQDLTYWPTQLARVQYVSGKTLNYTEATRLIGLKYANQAGKSIGNILRVEGALSSDQSKLLVITVNTDKPRKASFMAYDNERLNMALDKVAGTSKPYLTCNSAEIKDTSVGGFMSPRVYRLSYFGSIQGVELADNDDVYFLGSSADNDGLMLSKMNWDSNTATHQILDNPDWVSGKTEGEGIQLLGDDVLIGIASYHRWTVANRIYSFPQAAFTS